MTTHTLTITDHPDDGDPAVSLDGGTSYCGPVMVPATTLLSTDRAAMIAAVRDLTGPRDDLPADLRGDRRIAWVPDAGDGEGAWFAPLPVRQRLISEGWHSLSPAEYALLRPPAAPATEDVPWWEAVGRTVQDRGVTATVNSVVCGDGAGPSVIAYDPDLFPMLRRLHVPVKCDGKVTVLKDTDR